MKKALKKSLAIILALTMAFGAAPLAGLVGLELPSLKDVFVDEAEAATYGVLTYKIKNGEVIITDCDQSVSGALEIPSTISGYPVTIISDSAFDWCQNLTSLKISGNVRMIGYDAFYKCTGLESVSIPDSVTSIGSGAFEYCTSLTSVVIPDSVTSISSFTFELCTSLKSVTIPYSVTSIGGFAFEYCTSLASIVIPDSVTSIESSAFASCTSLTSVVIPDSITRIESSTFKSCTNLTSVVIPDSITVINYLAFQNCTNLKSVTIPNSVTIIGSSAFESCTNLTSVVIPDGVTSISDYAFCNCTGLKSVIIPDSVTSIGNYAFYECTELTSITIPDSVTRIGDQAFYCCTGLTSITIPDSVTIIENFVFYNCSSLTDIYYGGTEEQWEAITILAFNDCLFNATIHFNCENGVVDAIINTFVENRSMWVEESIDGYGNQYGFFDFNGDGILELVASTYTGTGFFSTNNYYKFDSANNSVVEVNDTVVPDNLGFDWSLSADLEPGYREHPVGFSLLKNKSTGKTVYLAVDKEYNGSWGYTERYGTIQMNSNNELVSEFLFSKYYNCNAEKWEYFWCFENGEETEISESEYNAKYSDFLSRYDELSMTSLMSGEINADMTDAELKEVLLRLYNAFSYESNMSSSSDFDEGINVFSSSGSTSIAQGESTHYAVCVYENGERKKDLSNLAFINETPDIFSLSRNNDTENGYLFITVKAKNCGIGFLQINDTSTGETARIIIAVINPKANSYTIYNVPELGKHGEHTPNILYFNGMSIDDFKYEKKDDDSCIVSFNVFNSLPVYAIVTVFDANGNAIYNTLIDKHEQYSESIYSGLVDEPINFLKDTLSGDLLSYRQIAGYSSETKVRVSIPSNGYIKITNNSSQSGVLEIINFFDAFMKFKSFVTGGIDLAKWAPVSYSCLETAAEELLKKTQDKHIKSFKSGMFIDAVKKITFSSDDLLYCANTLSDCVMNLDVDIMDVMTIAIDNGMKVGVNVLEDWFTSFAGPAAVALKGAFLYNTYFNIYEKLYYIGATSNVGAISIRNPNETTDTMTYDNVTVINPAGFDSETSLSTYMVSFDEGLPEDFKNNVLNSDIIKNFCESYNISIEQFVKNEELYQLHDITFIKNSEEYQPGNEVEVFLPVPTEMKSEANWWSRLKVYRLEEDGTLTDMNAKYSSGNGMVSFKTNHFSLYLVLVEKGLSIAIKNPSKTTINYGDSIILNVEIDYALPDGAYIEWSENNGNFDMSVSPDGMTCKVSPRSSGKTTFTATIYDRDGKIKGYDTQEMTAKAGLWQRIVAFFKKIFGMIKTIPEAFKGIII